VAIYSRKFKDYRVAAAVTGQRVKTIESAVSSAGPERRRMMGFETRNTQVNFTYFERNKKVVGSYCKSHPNETLMSAIQTKAK
jgi:hypothetical protein